MTFKLILLLGSFSIALNSVFAQAQQTPPPPPPPQLKIVNAAQIIIDRDSGKGQDLVTLRNTNTAKLKDISLTGLINTATGIRPSITFKAAAGNQTNPANDQNSRIDEGTAIYALGEMDANKLHDVIVVVTGVLEDGEFDLELRSNDDAVGTIKVIRPSFKVTLDGPNPNEADLSMIAATPTTLTLKNDDQLPYPLYWRLTIDGKEVCGDKVTLPAKGTGIIQCTPSVPFSPERLQDLFKVTSTNGNSLRLYPEKQGSFNPNSPWKSIPVKASLSYFSPTRQQIGGYVGIVLILIAGGLTSLVLSQALPNRLKRLNVRDRLKNIGMTTSNLSSKIGSRLQVLLRLERSRLLDLLESRNTFSPDFSGIVTRVNEDTDKLQARVALARQMDMLLGRLDQKITLGAPLSQVADIVALIDDAKAILMKAELTAKDLEIAQTAIADAENRLEKLNQEDPVFGETLATRAVEIKQDMAAVANSPTFLRIMKILPGVNATLQAADPARIPPANYASVDMAVEKMLLIKDYVRLMDGTLDSEILKRLGDKENKLLELLQLESCAAMHSARLLLRQMKGDVYPERIGEKLLAGAATITVEPRIAYDKAPLEFCVTFHSEEIDEAAAKEQWRCDWDFGDKLNGSDWNASHYFLLTKPRRFKSASPKDFIVRATFRNGNGEALVDPNSTEALTVEKTVNVLPSRHEKRFGDRARTELLKLMAALLIAVFALVSGAREQLLKLDILPGLIAVFLVGFGADTIKNLLSKSEST